MHERLFRAGLPSGVSSGDPLGDNRELKNTVNRARKAPQNISLTRITIQLRTNTISVMGYFHPVLLQYSSSNSSFVIGTFATFLNPLTTDPAIDDTTSELMAFGSKSHG